MIKVVVVAATAAAAVVVVVVIVVVVVVTATAAAVAVIGYHLSVKLDLILIKPKIILISSILNGPACDSVCETAGLLAGRWAVPMISYGCEDSKLSDRTLYPTFFRTTSKFTAMTGFLEDVLTYFNWEQVTLVTTDNRVWIETEEEIIREFPTRITTMTWNILSTDWSNIQPTLLQKSKESHVFLLLMFGLDVLRFLYEAKTVGLLGGEHVFITIDFANMGKRMAHPLDGNHLTGVLDITLDVTPESEVFSNFLSQIEANFTYLNEDIVEDQCAHYELAIHAGLMYDGMLIYAKAVDATVRENIDPKRGLQLSQNIYNSIIQGVTGRVHINADGSRDAQFMLHNLQEGCYVPIARSAVTLSLKRQENSRAWIIHIDDLKLRGRSKSHLSASPVNSRSFRASRTSFSTESSLGQAFTEQYIYKGEDVAGKTITIPLSKYQIGPASKRVSSKTAKPQGGQQAAKELSSGGGAVKQLGIAATINTGGPGGRPGLVITKQLTKEVNHIMALSHPNLCRFYGVCVDVGTEMTVWEYCRKGSLQDVIHNDKKYLEDMPFKISFINDITN
ncbi:guanylate cyclase, partial [Elysia marginata]